MNSSLVSESILIAAVGDVLVKREHPDDKTMQVSHETIYQALFVQGKGSLRTEVATALRCGRRRGGCGP